MIWVFKKIKNNDYASYINKSKFNRTNNKMSCRNK